MFEDEGEGGRGKAGGQYLSDGRGGRRIVLHNGIAHFLYPAPPRNRWLGEYRPAGCGVAPWIKYLAKFAGLVSVPIIPGYSSTSHAIGSDWSRYLTGTLHHRWYPPRQEGHERGALWLAARAAAWRAR